ncbi:MAG: CHAD domain-containing protein [Phycisphaerae bacterium]|nr:CHAD domain-containing protein [Phycisphaerae bacterium]MDW8261625.1 CHAD domain-containing protein [Phycisphaerales bacterium]
MSQAHSEGSTVGLASHAATACDAPPRLVVYLDDLIDQLQRHVSKVLSDGDVESIHQARVATRRLKAACDLLAPILPTGARKRFKGLLRRVRRRLGRLRDIDVMAQHLADLSTEPGAGDACAWLAEGLQLERDPALHAARRAKSLERIDSKVKVWSKLRRRVIECAQAIDVLLAESLHTQIDAFAGRAAELDAHEPGVDPHVVRIAGKSLRYSIEMAVAHGRPLEDSLLRSFKKLQDALGLWHDLVVIVEHAQARAASEMLAHHDATLQRSVLALAGAALRQADGQLEQFRKLWSEHGNAIAQAIRTAFPLSREVPVTGSRKDRDPAGSEVSAVREGPH